MSATRQTIVTTRHSLPTRLVHAGMALAVVTALFASLGMEHPKPGFAGNFLFEIHEFGGLAAFSLIVLFWLVLTVRKRGTPAGLLFPWASARRRAAVWTDLKAHLAALCKLRLPAHDDDSPLASAVHGLGILLITAMSGTGTIFYFFGGGNPDAPGLISLDMGLHQALANLAWVYLIGHVSLAVLQHLFTDFNLRSMWSLRSAQQKETLK
ncbi:cytochrome b/b6 domain-containing protein [Phaeobacter sp. HF9A]|uniref:cytochrome b/b6 domain-containing protein n=1 Tax=Phaeobacter sp. HF9A TaxID=2721561 RepID=UPI00142FA639|nr:cytochrome b/b6 domain-containing protein [Phaeobacter sp. HF9A]NIZ11984.1 cytochrome b/b6 domain-containing protein [Phaeobacter sp. HF9A]